MNLIEQHMENVARELVQLELRMAWLKKEQDETRKLLNNIRRYRKSLNKQYPSSQATLPLAPPDDEEEEEATDEANDADAMHAAHPVVGGEPLVPDEWHPDYEVPEEPDESERAYRSRLDDQAESDKIGANQEPLGRYHREVEAQLRRSFPVDLSAKSEADATADAMAKDWEPAPAEPEKPIRRRKAKATAEE
jgi:hypothetical protein